MTTDPTSDLAYREQCARHYNYLISIMPALVGALRYGRAEIEEAQTAALRALIRASQERSRWHRPRLAGVDADRITAADLPRIPVMTKSDLMDHWDEVVTNPRLTLAGAEAYLRTFKEHRYFCEDHILMTSGGTSGPPGIFVYDWQAFAQNWGSMSRSLVPLILSKLGRPSELRMASVSVDVSAHGSYVMSRLFSNPERPIARFPITLPTAEITGGLNEARPEVLYCLASALSTLCDEAEAGRLVISPKLIFAGAEMLPDEVIARAKRIWDADVLTCWGASEATGTFPCPTGDGFHVSEDLVVLEPVDERNEPVPAGTKSAAVLLTNLYNPTMPLIRYKIDDIFELSPDPCRCGSQYKKVKKVHGRLFETFHYGDLAVHPALLESPILKQAKVIEYQIRQTPAGADLAIVANAPLERDRLIRSAREVLLHLGVADPVINVAQVDRIERTYSGKLRRYVPLERDDAGDARQ